MAGSKREKGRKEIRPKPGASGARVHLPYLEAYATTMVHDYGDNNAWFADTGANSHFASNLDKMDTSVAYNGTETLDVLDGDKLKMAFTSLEMTLLVIPFPLFSAFL
uniref:Polyprotein n=1 Tax=Cannabis sativa TaxID=3483 RepID=A0A803QBQ9_CANSA